MTTLTCEQTLAFVSEARPRDMTPGTAAAVAEHLLTCWDCRTGIVSCHIAESLMETHRRGLEAQSAVDLATHLVECDGCRSQADGMRQVQSLLENVDLPSGLAGRLQAATAEHLSRQLRARAFETPLGWAGLAYADTGIVLIRRYENTPADALQSLRERLGDFVAQERPRDDVGGEAVRKLVAYHEGERVTFDEPLDLSLVSAFTREVLRATLRIPYGDVRPYAWVAREIGRPKAYRAVGGALHVNPVAPIVPCHRVIASDNSLGGYGGGPEMKRWLLRLEGYLPGRL